MHRDNNTHSMMRKLHTPLAIAILGVFVFLFVLSCSLLSAIPLEHGMIDSSISHSVHEHAELPLSLPSQPLMVVAYFVSLLTSFIISIFCKSLFSNIYVRWRIAFRDYHRRIRENISCLYIALFRQGILHSKSF